MQRLYINKKLKIQGMLIEVKDFQKIHQIQCLIKSQKECQLPSHISRIRKNKQKAEIIIFVGNWQGCTSLFKKIDEITPYLIQEIELVYSGLETTDNNWNYQLSSYIQQQKELQQEQIQYFEQIQPFIPQLMDYDCLLIQNGIILISIKNNTVFINNKEQFISQEELQIPEYLLNEFSLLCRAREILINDKSFHFLTDCLLLCNREPTAYQGACLLHSRIKAVIFKQNTLHGVMNGIINYGQIEASNHKFQTFILTQ
ncbi:hypothetical protein SS50377_23111 [Spironucleus salmonicida]|uniref:Uncharacterized protein n=1 Tax=Spironucleus salmonicida TaxID=348837 RepID=V6LLY1_9EUKA|nr:hypothetical protein SS50377_23111 [Spironucleus salmonicida]|eukprot:EST41714.1 Hypothetical protein SS50377_18800 [Spironucleus salmonicida]